LHLVYFVAENDFYSFMGLGENRTITDVNDARRKKAVEIHPDNAESEEQRIEFVNLYAKVNSITQVRILK
jgi:DnaJ-class molecular chaperone